MFNVNKNVLSISDNPWLLWSLGFVYKLVATRKFPQPSIKEYRSPTSSKKQSPSYHRLVSIQIDSRPSQVVTHPQTGKSDVALQNKSPPKSHIKVILLGISDSSKKESPCFGWI